MLTRQSIFTGRGALSHVRLGRSVCIVCQSPLTSAVKDGPMLRINLRSTDIAYEI
ncbi:hypothetical protein RRSWK_01278 [Rhodopirellula sp. SWK7]|nr:hypothetical protein RRSWK_01278 [Rhodopirellula sp. SWK7]